MSRLPAPLQPAWPLLKRVHLLATRWWGRLARPVSRLAGERALPRRAAPSAAALAAADDTAVLHPGGHAEVLDRPVPEGRPRDHWRFEDARRLDVPPHHVLELRRGMVSGEWGAVVSARGTLDAETSEYFSVHRWEDHPVFLAPRLPAIHDVDGTVAALTTRGGGGNYYHFLMDVLPRWGILRECLPDVEPDAVLLPHSTRYHRELVTMLGLDQRPIVPAVAGTTVRADRMLVPSLPNPAEMAPAWTVDWLRSHLPARDVEGRPRRLYVTRGGGRNTRRLVSEPELWPELERRGFVRIDPGTLSVREQIDHFAAADVVVALHGAALTNLVFSPPGVRVLELFPHDYVKPCYWAVTTNLPGAVYHYLVDGDASQHGRDQSMLGIQSDIRLAPATVLDAVDRLLA